MILAVMACLGLSGQRAYASMLAVVADTEKSKEATFAGKTVQEWTGLLKATDPRMRLQAALAVGEAGDEARPAVKALTGALKDTYVAVRIAAAKTLSGLGPHAAPAVPNLAV